MKKRMSLLLTVLLLLSLAIPAAAKTQSSARAENLFVYAADREGKAVLLTVLSEKELQALAHGAPSGGNYCVSATDNYPTTQYCEGKGFTASELLEAVKAKTSVIGAEALAFSGDDTLRLMATDSYGSYSRSWSWKQLYGVKRYYFPGLYDSWNPGWEVSGEESSKSGLSLETYAAEYQSTDPYYADKRAVFTDGTETEAVFMTESFSGRTASENLTASTEPGIAGYIAENGGVVTGCLRSALSAECALRFAVPMTEADLMTAHRTAFDSFKWVYNLCFDCATSSLQSAGTVAEPIPSFKLDGNTLTVTLTCETEGAAIYYGFDGAPQALYTQPITVDMTGRDLDSSPFPIYATAVREGWDDAGILRFQYPGMAPGFRSLYIGMTDTPLTFTAAEGISAADWAAWCNAIDFVTMKAPGSSGYAAVDTGKLTTDTVEKTITLDASLFSAAGTYSFRFHAKGYADKSVSVTLKRAAPVLTADTLVPLGSPVTIRFTDPDYRQGLSLYVTDSEGGRSLISGTGLDRSRDGEVTITAAYLTGAASPLKQAGCYTLELVNNRYAPASRTISITLYPPFSDVSESAWYFPYVAALSAEGVINGMGDGRFDPAGKLTYGQAMRLLLVSCGYGEQPSTGTHWADGYMNAAAALGLLPAGTNPDAPISRLAFCQAAATALHAERQTAESPFADTEDAAVLSLWERGIISGTGDGSFDPEGTLTRAQISKIIWCMTHPEETK